MSPFTYAKLQTCRQQYVILGWSAECSVEWLVLATGLTSPQFSGSVVYLDDPKGGSVYALKCIFCFNYQVCDMDLEVSKCFMPRHKRFLAIAS